MATDRTVDRFFWTGQLIFVLFIRLASKMCPVFFTPKQNTESQSDECISSEHKNCISLILIIGFHHPLLIFPQIFKQTGKWKPSFCNIPFVIYSYFSFASMCDSDEQRQTAIIIFRIRLGLFCGEHRRTSQMEHLVTCVLVYKQGLEVEEALMEAFRTPCCLNLQTFLCFSIEAAVFNITQFLFIQKQQKRGGDIERTHCPSFSWQKCRTSIFLSFF